MPTVTDEFRTKFPEYGQYEAYRKESTAFYDTFLKHKLEYLSRGTGSGAWGEEEIDFIIELQRKYLGHVNAVSIENLVNQQKRFGFTLEKQAQLIYKALIDGQKISDELAKIPGMKEELVKLIEAETNIEIKALLRDYINNSESALYKFFAVQRGILAPVITAGTLDAAKKIIDNYPHESVLNSQQKNEALLFAAIKEKRWSELQRLLALREDTAPTDLAIYTAFAEALATNKAEAVKALEQVKPETIEFMLKHAVAFRNLPIIYALAEMTSANKPARTLVENQLRIALSDNKNEVVLALLQIKGDNRPLNMAELLIQAITAENELIITAIVQMNGDNKPSEEELYEAFKKAVQEDKKEIVALFASLKGEDWIKDILLDSITKEDTAVIRAIVQMDGDNKPSEEILYEAFKKAAQEDKTAIVALFASLKGKDWVQQILSDAITKEDTAVIQAIIQIEGANKPSEEILYKAFEQAVQEDKKEVVTLFALLKGEEWIRAMLLKAITKDDKVVVRAIVQMNEDNKPSEDALYKAFKMAVEKDKKEIIAVFTSLKGSDWFESALRKAVKNEDKEVIKAILDMEGNNKLSDIQIRTIFHEFLEPLQIDGVSGERVLPLFEREQSSLPWDLIEIFLTSIRKDAISSLDVHDLKQRLEGKPRKESMPTAETMLDVHDLLAHRAEGKLALDTAVLNQSPQKKSIPTAEEIYKKLKNNEAVPDNLARHPGMKERIVHLIKEDSEEREILINRMNDKNSALYKFLAVKRGGLVTAEQAGTLAQVKIVLGLTVEKTSFYSRFKDTLKQYRESLQPSSDEKSGPKGPG